LVISLIRGNAAKSNWTLVGMEMLRSAAEEE
jgi:hypothetical protein